MSNPLSISVAIGSTIVKLRVVLDNNVLFQAFVTSEGFGFRCLQLAEQGRFTLFRSSDSMRELAEVLAREPHPKGREFCKRFRNLVITNPQQFLSEFEADR